MFLSRLDKREKNLLLAAAACLVTLGVLARVLVTLSSHDYAYFLPRMLDNHLFYLANGFGIKEYTASFCAGIFEFANPQSVALSLPQLLAGIFGPVTGIQLTFVLVSAAAGAGIYGCARFAGLTHMPAMISALMMALSGFLLTRMMVGHLTFFNVGFAPLVAMLMLYGVRSFAEGRLGHALVCGGTAALLATSIVYGGAGVMILQIAAMIALLLVVCGGFSVRWDQWLRFFGGVSVVALLMSAPKLEAMLAVTGNLPRDFYPLPGVGLGDLPLVLLQAVLWIPDADGLDNLLKNRRFLLAWHEWNYSVSPLWVPLVAGGLVMGHRAGLGQMRAAWTWIAGSPVRTGFAALLLSLPLVLNVYTPSWNAFLKAMPVLGDSSSMVRWLLIYLPALCLLAGWAWRHLDRVRLTPLLLLAIGLGVQQYHIHTASLGDDMKVYDKSLITGPWQSGDVRPIYAVGAPIKTTKDGRRTPIVASNFDHLFVDGSSNALCYEPMFGYKLETLDRRHLRVATIKVQGKNGFLPMKNPSCYVYPAENACRPGAHFTGNQFDDLQLLTAYGDLPAKASALRGALNLVAAGIIPVTVLAVLGGLWQMRRRRADMGTGDTTL